MIYILSGEPVTAEQFFKSLPSFSIDVFVFSPGNEKIELETIDKEMDKEDINNFNNWSLKTPLDELKNKLIEKLSSKVSPPHLMHILLMDEKTFLNAFPEFKEEYYLNQADEHQTVHGRVDVERLTYEHDLKPTGDLKFSERKLIFTITSDNNQILLEDGLIYFIHTPILFSLTPKEVEELKDRNLNHGITLSFSFPKTKSPGVKNNQNKLPMSILFKQFPQALQAIILCSEYGHRKYPEDTDYQNFRRVEGGSQNYRDALVRHLSAGEKDKESGLPEEMHIAWNAMASLELFLAEKNINIKEFSESFLKHTNL